MLDVFSCSVFFKVRNIVFVLANRIECGVYHGDIPLKKRNEVHENFVKDHLQIVVATVAFGMGIDKPGIIYILLNLSSEINFKSLI